MNNSARPWYRELNRYHWFVFVVAALGWLFDTMDQQLFNLARAPAMRELLQPSPGVAPDPGVAREASTNVTAVFLMGWAVGGIGFGILGDRIGRAKTMMLTILVYSLFTGLSAFSRGVYDFALYRFLTGLGVGGEFAVGVSLVAEVMPERARPFALGLLQALSAVGNITAALISIGLGEMEKALMLQGLELFGFTLTPWRIMFLVGTLPALLALVIRRRLKEPERWTAAVATSKSAFRPGSIAELFGDPLWRKHALLGMVLAFSGVVGLWGIGFFSIDLNRSIFRKVFQTEAREAGDAAKDQEFVRFAVQQPEQLASFERLFGPEELISPEDSSRDAERLYAAALALRKAGKTVETESILNLLDDAKLSPAKKAQSEEDRARRAEYLDGSAPTVEVAKAHAQRIAARAGAINGQLNLWAGLTSLILNGGAFFGIYGFSIVTHYTGRRPAFAASFILAMLSTAMVFWFLDSIWDLWMVFVMGVCQLAIFGGYAIYFPELFPTRLRSTGTSFCYNVGRFVAAVGPYALGKLSTVAFGHLEEPLPWRYAGVTMCSIFLLGLIVLPFLPETRGKPLPE